METGGLMDVQGAQIAAIVIFIGMFGLIISEKVERHIVTLSAALLTLLVVFSLLMQDMGAVMKALNVQSIVQTPFWIAAESGGETSTGINWETIFFIAGMMVMVEGMADSGFFRWLCMALARMVRYKPIPLFLTFMVIAALLSMFIDSITVIMFLAAVTMELARTLKFDPVPMILSEIFCANLGGSATMCGDPPNIIIGTSLGYSFGNFLGNTGVIALASLAVVILYLYLCFRKQLVCAAPSDPREYPSPRSAITNKHGFIISWFIFIGAVLLLATHAQTGLTVSYIGVLIAAATLITSGKRAFEILKKVDYKTLLFFIGLFVVISGLEQTGVLEWLASLIAALSGGNALVIAAIILFGSGVASAFIDNIPFAATMIPVIRSIAETQGVPLGTLTWALAVGTDIGGNATPIGASANVVGTSIASKGGHPISWGRYCKVMAPLTLIVMGIALLIIKLRYFG